MLNPKVKFPLSIHLRLSCTAANTERGKDLWTVCILHLNSMMLLFLGFHSAFFQMSSGKNSLVCCFFQGLYLPCVGSTQNLLLNLQKVSWSDKTACVVFPKQEKSAFLFKFSNLQGWYRRFPCQYHIDTNNTIDFSNHSVLVVISSKKKGNCILIYHHPKQLIVLRSREHFCTDQIPKIPEPLYSNITPTPCSLVLSKDYLQTLH